MIRRCRSTSAGGIASSDFSFYDGPLDDNQAYSFHTYNFLSSALGESHLEDLAEMAESRTPLRRRPMSRTVT